MEPQNEVQILRKQLNELKSTNKSLETKTKSLESQAKSLQQKNESLETKVKLLEKEFSTDKKMNRHSEEFWDEIQNKINKKDTDYIKSLIKNKTITINDVNDSGNTLLHLAALGANYEIAQLCINLGADLKCKNKMGESLMDKAIGGNAPNIQQLLLFSEMKANIGERIKNISSDINKQNGVIDNILNELSLIGDQSKQLFLKILNEIMVNIIQKKLVFSDDLLNLCWKISTINNNNNNPLKSELWQTIKQTCNEVIKGRNKRDWYWIKNCVIPSTIWYKEQIDSGNHIYYATDFRQGESGIVLYNWIKDTDEEKEKTKDTEEKTKATSYLYHKLLDLVKHESDHQLDVLQNNMKEQQNKDKDSWTQLIKWDIIHKNEAGSIARQDTIANGIIAEYPRHQLINEAVNIKFDAAKFYDHNQYISKLLLLAQMIDDDFQKSIQKMFDIDKYSNIGKINPDSERKYEDDDIISIHYTRGPVKQLTRARAKAEVDYFDETYPTSACILDFNRCTLTFRRIKSLLFAVELFVNKVHYYQSGSIIAIVRVKNGWKQYASNPQYADIKINVVIRGQRHNIIGEVQFMLDTMSAYKKVAHNLYAITREEDFVTNSASKILPSLLNISEQRNVLAGSNDVKGLLRLMVFSNNTKQDLLSVDKERNQTILTTICESGNLGALQFVLSLMNDEEHVKYLFLTDLYNQTPIDNVVAKNHLSLIQCLFALQSIREKHNPNNEDQETQKALFRLIFYVLCFGEESWSILDDLGITQKHIAKALRYKYPKQNLIKGAWQFHNYTNIIIRVIQTNNLNQLQKVAALIGEEEMILNVLKPDAWNVTGLERAIQYNKLDTIKYLLSFEGIKNVYNPNYKNSDETTSSKSIFTLLLWLFGKCKEDDTVDYVLNELNLDKKEVIAKYLNYKCAKAGTEFAPKAFSYHNKNIIHAIKTKERLKKMVAIIGESAMIENMLKDDEWNMNGFGNAIQNHSLDIIEYILECEEIKNLYNAKNTNERSLKLIYRLLYWLFCEPDNEKMMDYILNALNFEKEDVIKFVRYRYPCNDYVADSMAYHKWYIFGRMIFVNTLDALQRLVDIVGEKVLIQEVLISNGDNINGLEYALRRQKVEIIQYLLSFEEIKNECRTNTEILWRILYWMNVAKCNQTLIKYVMNTLDLNEKQLKELQSFQCPKPDADYHFVYWNKKLSDEVIRKMLKAQSSTGS